MRHTQVPIPGTKRAINVVVSADNAAYCAVADVCDLQPSTGCLVAQVRRSIRERTDQLQAIDKLPLSVELVFNFYEDSQDCEDFAGYPQVLINVRNSSWLAVPDSVALQIYIAPSLAFDLIAAAEALGSEKEE